MPLLQSPEQVFVVRQRELGVQTPDDVEFAGRVVPGGVSFREYLIQLAGVRPLFLRHPGERAEDAGVAEDADVGGVQVLIGGEIDARPVPFSVHLVGQPADGEEVVRLEQGEGIVAGEPFAPVDFRGDGVETAVPRAAGDHASARFSPSVTLCPPKPKLLDNATSSRRWTAWFGAALRSQAGSGVNWLMVGGTTPCLMASAQAANSSAPAAPSRWPVIDLVEPKMRFRACGPKTLLTAAVSAASPCGVDVPCALM